MERQNNAILGEQSPDLIAEPRTAANQAAADAMQRLQVLLGDGLRRNKPHLWPAEGLTNHCGIPGIARGMGHSRERSWNLAPLLTRAGMLMVQQIHPVLARSCIALKKYSMSGRSVSNPPKPPVVGGQ